jgi:hypothetical protein
VAEIRIPYTDRSEPLVSAIGKLQRELDGDEAATFRGAALGFLFEKPRATVGDLLQRFENADAGERRRLADAARESEGLETFSAAERRRAWEHQELNARTAALKCRDEYGRIMQTCAAEDCIAFTSDVNGMPDPSDVKRYWCSEHQHLAEPGDLEPIPRGVPVNPGTGMPLNPPDEEEERKWQAYRDRCRQEREAREAAEERLRKLEADHRAKETLPRYLQGTL